MSASLRIQEALDQHGLPDEHMQRASQHPCQGVRFHSPTPHSTRLWEFRNPAVSEQETFTIYLCPTCETNLEILIHLIEQAGRPEWPVLREFAYPLRAITRKIGLIA